MFLLILFYLRHWLTSAARGLWLNHDNVVWWYELVLYEAGCYLRCKKLWNCTRLESGRNVLFSSHLVTFANFLPHSLTYHLMFPASQLTGDRMKHTVTLNKNTKFTGFEHLLETFRITEVHNQNVVIYGHFNTVALLVIHLRFKYSSVQVIMRRAATISQPRWQ